MTYPETPEISEEIVQKLASRTGIGCVCRDCIEKARAALEAVAPSLRAQGMRMALEILKAKAEEVAWSDGMEAFNAFTIAQWSVDIRARANQLEGGNG
jgi:hypothetical protein